MSDPVSRARAFALDDGRTAMSMTVHPSPGEEHVRLHAVGGPARFTGLRLREH